jgi:DNA-directed RNA polymerase specialized sigma24 family protein
MGDAIPPDFAEFVENLGPRLRHAFIAAYGPHKGAEVTARILALAQRRWDEFGPMDNRAARLYQLGRRQARRVGGGDRLPEVPPTSEIWVEPDLPRSLQALAQKERVAVLLNYGFGRPPVESAELLGLNPSTVQLLIDLGFGQLQAERGGEAAAAFRGLDDQVAAYAEVLDGRAPGLDELLDGHSPARVFPWRRVLGMVIVVLALGLLFAVFAGSDSASDGDNAGTTPPAVPPVTANLLNPQAVTQEMFSEVGHSYAGPGGVVAVDGSFHMFSSAYGNGHNEVTHLVSADGIVWAQAAPLAILDLASAPWAPLNPDQALVRSAAINSDGEWQLYFEIGWFDDVADRERSAIGRAVAAAPDGDWMFDPEPVLRPSDQLPWAAARVASPSVVASPDGLVMLFIGVDESGAGRVGLAQSLTGAEWDVRPGPVFGPLRDWEGTGPVRVDLLEVPSGFAMFYSDPTGGRRGLALSPDGLEWTPHPTNPVLGPADVPGAEIYDTEFIADAVGILAFVENGDRASRSVSLVLLSAATGLG